MNAEIYAQNIYDEKAGYCPAAQHIRLFRNICPKMHRKRCVQALTMASAWF
ncbi:MAG: hypothetical protein FWG99_02280 [Treponema sp.]|nr:hypothetical protein [Treponema sp.]